MKKRILIWLPNCKKQPSMSYMGSWVIKLMPKCVWSYAGKIKNCEIMCTWAQETIILKLRSFTLIMACFLVIRNWVKMSDGCLHS